MDQSLLEGIKMLVMVIDYIEGHYYNIGCLHQAPDN